MTLIWLAEITANVATSPSQEVLRVASPPGYSATGAPGYYAPLLKQPALFRRAISFDGGVVQASVNAYGLLVISNMDARFDGWLTYGYGAEATLLIGDHQAAYGSFVTVLNGIAEQPDGDDRELRFRLRGQARKLDLPASPNAYAGDNLESPSTGLEGTPDDLKGAAKLRTFGRVFNVALDPVDTSDNLFAGNHDVSGSKNALASVDAVRVNGAAWSAGTNHGNVTDVQNASPAQGDFDTARVAALVKLGGTIGQGQVTADLTEATVGSPDIENNIAALVRRLVEEAGMSLVGGDEAALESAAPFEAGIVIRDGSFRDAIDALRTGALAWIGESRTGALNLKRVSLPSGSPSATFRRVDPPNVAAASDFAIRRLDRLPPTMPVWQVTVEYARMQHVQSADALASGVSEADKAKYSRAYRSVTVEDASIQTMFPLAERITVQTALTRQEDAQTLAGDLLSLLGELREEYRLLADYDAALAAALDLGDVVKLYHPRFGLSGGKLFNVHGIEYDARRFSVELTLWG